MIFQAIQRDLNEVAETVDLQNHWIEGTHREGVPPNVQENTTTEIQDKEAIEMERRVRDTSQDETMSSQTKRETKNTLLKDKQHKNMYHKKQKHAKENKQ